MSLLDPTPEPSNKTKAFAFTTAAIVVALAIALFFVFRYYPEKKATEHFLDALVAGDTKHAYELWKPSGSYSYGDFMADWGPDGYYGPVKSFAIVKSSAKKGANGVIVLVEVSPFSPVPDKNDVEKSRRTKQIAVWVKSDDKALSFPPPF
jgi:hypothetical protein